MPPKPAFAKVTAAEAANRLDCAPGTIYSWGTRYAARKVTLGRRAFYDFNDLAVIEREIRHGHPVPSTPEGRAAIRARCPLAADRAA